MCIFFIINTVFVHLIAVFSTFRLDDVIGVSFPLIRFLYLCFCVLDEVVTKYRNAKLNLRSLERFGASVLHGVDATKMKHHVDLYMRKFDRIIFNFPHAGFFGKEDNPLMIQ